MSNLLGLFKRLNLDEKQNDGNHVLCSCLGYYCIDIPFGSQFVSKIKSSVEADLIVNKKVINNIKATGGGSTIEVVLMNGKTANNECRSHWGLILEQKGDWVLNGKARNCVLFHHNNKNGIEVGVGCIQCVRSRVKNIYGKDVPKPNINVFDCGESCAAVGRFLGDKSLKRTVKHCNHRKYTTDIENNERKSINDCRIVFDLLWFLMLDYQMACETVVDSMNTKEVKQKLKMIYDDNPQFLQDLCKMWFQISADDELTNVNKILKYQYRFDISLVTEIVPSKIQNSILKEVLKDNHILRKENNIEFKHEIEILNKNMNDMKQENINLKNELQDMKKQLTTEMNILKFAVNNLRNKYNELQKSIKKDDELLLFLKRINMDMYYDVFINEGFERMADLNDITKDILQDMGIKKIGHYTKILNGIKNHNHNTNEGNVF